MYGKPPTPNSLARAAAKAAGAMKYEGSPCKNCGTTLRYTRANGPCVSCTREKQEKARKNTPQKKDLWVKVAALEAALKLYVHCRHGTPQCFCTREARAAIGGPK